MFRSVYQAEVHWTQLWYNKQVSPYRYGAQAKANTHSYTLSGIYECDNYHQANTTFEVYTIFSPIYNFKQTIKSIYTTAKFLWMVLGLLYSYICEYIQIENGSVYMLSSQTQTKAILNIIIHLRGFCVGLGLWVMKRMLAL